MDIDYKEKIEARIKYAAKSYSIGLMHETYGMLEGLAMAHVIEYSYYVETSSRICKDYFNNAAWCNKCYRRYDA